MLVQLNYGDTDQAEVALEGDVRCQPALDEKCDSSSKKVAIRWTTENTESGEVVERTMTSSKATSPNPTTRASSVLVWDLHTKSSARRKFPLAYGSVLVAWSELSSHTKESICRNRFQNGSQHKFSIAMLEC